MNLVANVAQAMIAYFEGDLRRINHFLKVYGFAKTIGELERLGQGEQQILEIAALTHDIGIKVSERKYSSASGEHQQQEGPAEARALLNALNVPEPVVGRVCWLIARHHTYRDIVGMDYPCLVEADFLVNMYEDDLPAASIERIRKEIFKPPSGISLLKSLYPTLG